MKSLRSLDSAAGTGALLAFGAMCCVHLAGAASVQLSDRISAQDLAWLRLAWASVILVAVARPWRHPLSRSALLVCVGLGIVTAGVTMLYMQAITRLPLGTASALEFLGPLGIAVAQARGAARWWAIVPAVGVAVLTEPWRGEADMVGILLALGAAACWAMYILLTQRAGDEITGVQALSISIPVAALTATCVVGTSVVSRIPWQVALVGLGVALLLPVIPFSLEMAALRRLTTAAFGTLMSLQPAVAVVIGFIVLGQVPGPGVIVGIALVVAAGIGAARTGQRRFTDPPSKTTVADADCRPSEVDLEDPVPD